MMKKIILAFLAIAAVTILLVPLNRKQDCSDQDLLNVLSESNAALERFTLDNGIICLVKEDHSAPVCSIQFWIGNGAIHEGKYLGSGISHAIEHMIFKGTTNTEPGDLTRKINDAGGKINAYTGYDRTVFLTDLPSKNWEIGLKLLAEALMDPAFPEDEWAKEKDVILREIAMGHDDPDRVIGKLMFRTAYRQHPYRYPVIGYEDTFTKITRDDLLNFYKDNYVSDNIIAVIAGDIKTAEVKSALAETFEPFKRKSRSPILVPEEPKQISARFERATGAYKRSRLEWAYHTVPLTHPDAAALDILAIIVGQGDSSRLSLKIKDDLQLADSINAWSYTPKEAGLFGITAKFDPAHEDQLIKALENEILSWTKTRLARNEIEKAKRKILTQQLSPLETMSGQARDHASGEFYAADPSYSETYLKRVNDITPRQLLKTARRYLRPENRSLVILSPETEAKDEGKATDSKETLKPMAQKHILSTGTPLIVYENNKLPFAYVCIACKGGLLSENESNTGITQLMSDMLTRGTTSRTAEDIARTSESLGGHISNFSGRNAFGLRAKFLSCDAEIFMELIGDCITNPQFDDEELDKRKQLQIASIKTREESPFQKAQKTLQKSLFPDHPYQWDVEGTEESVKQLTRADLKKHFRRLAAADNMVITMAGNIDSETAIKLAEQFLTELPNQPVDLPEHQSPAPDLPARSINSMPKQQAIILVGMPGISVTDQRQDAIAIIEEAMSGLSSKLSTEIREKRGLAYYSGAYNSTGIEPGAYVVYAGTKAEAVEEVEQLMKTELQRVAEKGLTTEEIERAKNRILAAHDMSLQNIGSTSFRCALDELYGLGYNHSFSTSDRINAITSKDIVETARSIFSLDKCSVSIVVPETEN